MRPIGSPANAPMRPPASAASVPARPSAPVATGYIAQRLAGAAPSQAAATLLPSPRAPAPGLATATANPPAAVARDEPLVHDADTEARWRQVLDGINARKRLLGAFLEESHFLGCGEQTLVVAMDDLHRAVIEEKDNRALLTDEVRRVFGQPLSVRCATLDAAGPLAQRPTLEETQAMVARTLAWFGGEAAHPEDRRAAEGNAG